jgi:hypothetical protein
MTEKQFLVRFKAAGLTPQLVAAERAEFHGDHIVLVNAKGQCAALFLGEVIESWSEFTSEPVHELPSLRRA